MPNLGGWEWVIVSAICCGSALLAVAVVGAVVMFSKRNKSVDEGG